MLILGVLMFLFLYVHSFYTANPQHLVLTNPWEMVTNLWVYSIKRPCLDFYPVSVDCIKSEIIPSKVSCYFQNAESVGIVTALIFVWVLIIAMWFIVFYIHGGA